MCSDGTIHHFKRCANIETAGIKAGDPRPQQTFLCFLLLFCGLSGKSRSHTASGRPPVAPPCSPAHLPGPMSAAGRDINNGS